MVMEFCIGGPFHLEPPEARAQSRGRGGAGPARGMAAGDARSEVPGCLLEDVGSGADGEAARGHDGDGRRVRDPDVRDPPYFVFTVSRDFVRGCRTPILVLPDDVPAHPYAVAMESAMLAPNAEVSLFPWKEPKDRIPLAVRHIHSFLKAHRPAECAEEEPANHIARVPWRWLSFAADAPRRSRSLPRWRSPRERPFDW